MKKVEFDFTTTQFGNQWVDYAFNTYVGYKDRYEEYLRELGAMEEGVHQRVLVKTWRVREENTLHPRYKARLYQRVDAYIKKHQSPTWEFSHFEEDEEKEYENSWDDFANTYIVYNLYANIKEKQELYSTEPYENLVSHLKGLQQKVIESREKLIKEIITMRNNS